MIREYIKPDKNKIQITIPDEFVNEELEIIVFPTSEISRQAKTPKLIEQMKEQFDSAKTIKIPKDIDIDNLMNEMNDALS